MSAYRNLQLYVNRLYVNMVYSGELSLLVPVKGSVNVGIFFLNKCEKLYQKVRRVAEKH